MQNKFYLPKLTNIKKCRICYTIDQAYPHVRNAYVALGFPDILFSPDNAFTQLINQLRSRNADVVLGLFPADKPEKTDMVEIDTNPLYYYIKQGIAEGRGPENLRREDKSKCPHVAMKPSQEEVFRSCSSLTLVIDHNLGGGANHYRDQQ